MQKIKFAVQMICSVLLMLNVQAQQRFPTLIRSSLENEIIILSVGQPVYYPGDTVKIKVERNSKRATAIATPILIMEETSLIPTDNNLFIAAIPEACPPGVYRVRLRIKDAGGRRYIYATDCVVNVAEHQVIERISRFVYIEPDSGGENQQSAVTLDPSQIRELRVIFRRDSIGMGMGPQFVTIRTTIQLRDGTIGQTFERRVLTFRSDNDPDRDYSMLIQYRRAYGPYAAVKSDEFGQVQINVDSLPAWAIIKINIEPDYTIKIGGYDRSNSYTRYFHVRGPKIEVGLSLGIPKVLFDSQAKDTIQYGNYSAMLRFYYVNEITGLRFPVSFGIGTYGVNSPIDVNAGRGGFALSLLFNVAEMTRMIGINLSKTITAGLELAPFFPLEKRGRFLIAAQVGISL
ncbi:MAG: hypothetical protein COW85_04950, partial [Ignavibacteria bacterium CG22_combo_CG10-13_8_21_14_all_37_15]